MRKTGFICRIIIRSAPCFLWKKTGDTLTAFVLPSCRGVYDRSVSEQGGKGQMQVTYSLLRPVWNYNQFYQFPFMTKFRKTRITQKLTIKIGRHIVTQSSQGRQGCKPGF
jgi:hypothetical protein